MSWSLLSPVSFTGLAAVFRSSLSKITDIAQREWQTPSGYCHLAHFAYMMPNGGDHEYVATHRDGPGAIPA
jgi:hypothetical protein